MKFAACKYLDFSDNYYNATKQVLGGGKVFWFRKAVIGGTPSMVQFCKKRGRLNSPEACTSEHYAKCSDYVEIEHEVDDSTIPL